MASHLIVAPAASGKTAYAVALARHAAEGLHTMPIVVVASQLQARAWKRRLAQAGGTMGVRVLTFYGLYAECLGASGEAYTELSEPVRYRLIRSVVDGLPLHHYASLVARPGFVQVLADLIAELKTALIRPEAFSAAVDAMGGQPRLRELASVYTAYEQWLKAEGWSDAAGLGWLAVEALERRSRQAGYDWPLIIMDGFDDLTPAQLALLRALACRAGELVVTLTGTPDGSERPQAHRRFARTRKAIEEALAIRAETLPGANRAEQSEPSHPLQAIEQRLFRTGTAPVDAQGAVGMVEAPDRAGEVREALRWLKARVVLDGIRPWEMALLARDPAPYRPYVLQVAAEVGLPVRLVGGLPLRANPAVAALLRLLLLSLPFGADDPQPAMPRRRVVEAWRSPYFDWQGILSAGHAGPTGDLASGADELDAAARWGRVIGGLAQWREVLQRLEARAGEAEALSEDEEQPAGGTLGTAAGALCDKFERFAARLAPPQGPSPVREYVRWLEDLVGPDPDQEIIPRAQEAAEATPPAHLGMIARAGQGAGDLAERDISALRALKEVLRGLVWAEEVLGSRGGVDYARFFSELSGAVDAAGYDLPSHSERDEVVVAGVAGARGVGFRAVAVMGLAEGEFPASVREDAFLTDADRRALTGLGVGLAPSTESAESEFFYGAVTGARERLLLTRPRLAENGALWQASPFWEEVQRLVGVTPARLTSESPVPPDRVASWPELLESLASGAFAGELEAWVATQQPLRHEALQSAVGVLRARLSGEGDTSFDGDLSRLSGEIGARYGPNHAWSASRLESYRGCHFSFFVGSALGLEPRQEPEEGMDVAQKGTLYHRILERLYQHPRVQDRLDLAQLLEVLPEVAGQVLDNAPQEIGFRETAWWAQTRAEMVADVENTLRALVELPDEFVPCRFEARFGLEGQPPLEVRTGSGSLLLHGVIDRVDRTPDGRVRVIDYKSGGPSPYSLQAVLEGKKLQLPIYALAARDALGLGEPVEGFYWHIRQARRGSFHLSAGDGPDALMQATAFHAWEAVEGVRAGRFAPRPPDDGCPPWCPAASFCWHLRPRFEA